MIRRSKYVWSTSVACSAVRPPTSLPATVTPAAITGGVWAPAGALDGERGDDKSEGEKRAMHRHAILDEPTAAILHGVNDRLREP